MGKRKLSAGAQIINLWDQLNEVEKTLVRDVIRSAEPKKAGGKKSSSKKAAAPTADNGSDDAASVINS